MLCILRRRHPGAHITPLILAASEEHYNVHTTFTETLTTEYNHEDLASLPRPLQFASPSLPSINLTVKISQSAPSTSQPVPITQQSSSVLLSPPRSSARPLPLLPTVMRSFVQNIEANSRPGWRLPVYRILYLVPNTAVRQALGIRWWKFVIR